MKTIRILILILIAFAPAPSFAEDGSSTPENWRVGNRWFQGALASPAVEEYDRAIRVAYAAQLGEKSGESNHATIAWKLAAFDWVLVAAKARMNKTQGQVSLLPDAGASCCEEHKSGEPLDTPEHSKTRLVNGFHSVRSR